MQPHGLLLNWFMSISVSSLLLLHYFAQWLVACVLYILHMKILGRRFLPILYICWMLFLWIIHVFLFFSMRFSLYIKTLRLDFWVKCSWVIYFWVLSTNVASVYSYSMGSWGESHFVHCWWARSDWRLHGS